MKALGSGLVVIATISAAMLPGGDHTADEIHWTFTGPTSVTVHWRGSAGAVRYGLTRRLGDTVGAAEPIPLPFSSQGPFREARITGLAENTRYYYSIGKGTAHTFHTPPARGASGFTFHVQGDIGSAHDWHHMATCQRMIADARPAFVLCVGDLTYGNSTGQYAVDNHFNDVMVWSLDAAYMPAWGNHEWDEPEDDDMRNYKGRFELPNPQSSPEYGGHRYAGGGEDWYWFDYGNVRFIAYPEPWPGAWDDWHQRVKPVMEQAQGDSAIDFIVTFGHRPAYSSGLHPGEARIKTILGSLGAGYDKYVLNFNGHSHNYERTHPQSGVVHVTAGTGGADLEGASDPRCLWHGGCPPPAWSAFRAMHYVVVEIRVEPGRIDGRVLCGPPGGGRDHGTDITCAKGSVVDAFSIVRTAPSRSRRASGAVGERSGP